MEPQTVALTLRQVRQRLNNRWVEEKQQREKNQHDSTNQLQKTGDVHGHSLREKEQFEDSQSGLC